MSDVKTTYKDIEVTYDERENRWTFELRGRERFAKSLAKAKEAIDKPPPKNKEKSTFVPFNAWHMDYTGVKRVRVTSIADSAYAGPQVWITDKHGNRSKVRTGELYPLEQNAAIVAQIESLKNELELVRKKIDIEERKLIPISLPPREEE